MCVNFYGHNYYGYLYNSIYYNDGICLFNRDVKKVHAKA